MVTPRSRMLRISCDEGVGLGRVHAGDRLVQQQHGRIGGERQRHADKPLLAIGQRAREIVSAALEADPFDQFAGALPASAARDDRARGRPRMRFEQASTLP